MTRPLALDLFCGAGGASMGLYRAGFDVIGVDIKRQPRYPFLFIHADALAPPVRLADFDLIWASPPCQHYSAVTKAHRRHLHPDLIEPVRRLLLSHRCWVIENVPNSPLISPTVLCGSAFGLRVRRHRHFEASFPLVFTPECQHERQGHPVDVSGHGGRRKLRKPGDHGGRLYAPLNVADARDAMGIDWMNRDQLAQAIPPAYSEFIGHWALRSLDIGRTAA